MTSESVYLDLNTLNATSKAAENKERILILTPLLKRNAIDHLDRYFELLDQSTYPNHLISIGLLVSTQDDVDPLLIAVQQMIQRLERRWFHAFHDITVYNKDFLYDFNNDDHSQDDFKLQPYRRSMMARARNYLLSSALEPDHSWVAWVDVDLASYPSNVFDDLMAHDVDVIVPNCLLATEDGSFWGYDRRNWQETDYSSRFQRTIGDDFVMMEGYDDQLATGRSRMVDMPTQVGIDYKVPLDGVGTSFTLVKAHVHREGANFPSFPLQHQVDSEGFGRMVRGMGYEVYGLPSYFVYHS
ncbi:hypothetical protein DM01DRAFT_1330765 [Hesseltinella vesiculosa]|uniref:Anp1-domain-containing protein n=1 Tax=Hesseltinella vesiculosa TaxID=101127 RepID=A0A1X2GX33_9FUNG|nr:hypothetical protein DM01DRAFT_1330765 [Hesseltinella vesiculosa]